MGWMSAIYIWYPWLLVEFTLSGVSSKPLVIWGTTPAVYRVSMPSRAGTAVGDSFCWHEESAMASAVSSDSSDLDSLLLHGRGMDRKLRILTCGLLWSQLRAVSL